MKWIITHSPEYRRRIGTGNVKPEEAGKFEHRWRTLDADGEVSFYGKSDSIGFAPLDDFCRADIGDVEIQFKGDDDQWHGL